MTTLTAIRFAQAEETALASSRADAAHSAWTRTDRIVAEAPGRSGWACRAGCAACCHLLVRVTPGEADAIAAHVDESRSAAQRDDLIGRLEVVAEKAREGDVAAYRRERIRCAFLAADDRCSIYAVRPVLCRVHASRSADSCNDLASVPLLDTWLSKVGKAVHAGLGSEDPEELHAAVLRRLT